MPSPSEHIPRFSEKRHVGRPNIPDRERVLDLIGGALDRRWLTNDGPLVQEFEQQVCRMLGAEHCVAVSNGTLGLQLAAQALCVRGEVVMPSFTFVATAHAMRFMGARPVFADIDPASHSLDPAAVESAITTETGGIMGVHLWGRGGRAEDLEAVAAHHGLPLIFDAAHAFGCTHMGRPLADFGDAAVLSFHATKVVNAGEGGAVITKDATLAERLRQLRNFGFVDWDTVADVGTNAKMSELSAAMGIASLESFESFIAVNRRNYDRYASELTTIDGVRLLPHDDRDVHNFHYVVIEVAAERRDELVAALERENVMARRYFYPGCHRQAPYRTAAPVLPATDAVSGRVVTLPTGTAMSRDDVSAVCAIVRQFVGDGTVVSPGTAVV